MSFLNHIAREALRRRDRFPDPVPLPPLLPPGPVLVAAIDLGQAQDYSALVVVERTKQPDPTREERQANFFAVRHIHRWPLGTSYPSIVADVKGMFEGPPLQGAQLVLDATGVGRPLTDMFRAAGGGWKSLRPYTITSGESASGATCPKKDLVSAVQVPLQSRRLTISAALPLAETLAAELEHFRAKVTASRNETFEAWRERDHDDLVLALALAVFVADICEYCVGGLT